MRRTKIDRLAEELARVHDPGWAEWAAKGPGRFDHWKRLARHVLKRERAARGRVIGYVEFGYDNDGDSWIGQLYDPDGLHYLEADIAKKGHGRLARVVLVPRKRRAR